MLLLHDDADVGNTGHITTAYGTPDWSTTSKWNGSMNFASTDYLTIPDSADWNFGAGDFTIDTWVKFDTYSAGGGYYFLGQEDSGASYWVPQQYGGNLGWGANAANYSCGAWAPTAGTWYHVAWVVTGGTGLKCYVDGTQVGNSVTIPAVGDLSDPNYIARQRDGSGPFPGSLDELRISKGVARWTTNFTPPTEPYTSDASTVLLHHFDGDVAVGAAAKHTVTFNGTPQMHTTCKWNGSVYFNGTTDYLSIPDSADFDLTSGDYTIDFWVRFNNAGTNEAYIMGQFESAPLYWIVGLYNSKLAYGYGTAPYWTYFDPWEPAANTWYHLAFVFQGGNVSAYIDGVQSGTTQSTTIPNPAAVLTIGQVVSQFFHAGYLDEIRFTKGKARWTANFTPPTAPYYE